ARRHQHEADLAAGRKKRDRLLRKRAGVHVQRGLATRVRSGLRDRAYLHHLRTLDYGTSVDRKLRHFKIALHQALLDELSQGPTCFTGELTDARPRIDGGDVPRLLLLRLRERQCHLLVRRFRERDAIIGEDDALASPHFSESPLWA